MGSVVFLFGAAVGVPRVFTTADPEERTRMLREHAGRWRAAQVPYAVGPLLAAAGVVLAALDAVDPVRLVLGLAGLTLLVGALSWSLSCAMRGVRHLDFARGELPGWPFRAYVQLTLMGLALLGAAALLSGGPTWVGWLVLVADASFVAWYAVTDDIPPFAFYLLLLPVGLTL